MDYQVECRSDYDYAGRPVAFYWQGQRLEILTILSYWRIPEGKKFRVSVEPGQVFDLLYNEVVDTWEITQI